MHKLKSSGPSKANQEGRYHATEEIELDRDADKLVECWYISHLFALDFCFIIYKMKLIISYHKVVVSTK